MHTRITVELPVRHPARPATLFVAPIAAATLGVPEEEFHTRILPRLTQNDFSDHNAISNSPKGSCDPVRQQCPLPGPLTTFQPTVETWADRAAVRRFEGDSPTRLPMISQVKQHVRNRLSISKLSTHLHPLVLCTRQLHTHGLPQA